MELVQRGRSIDFSASGVLPLAGRMLLQWDQTQLPATRIKRVVQRSGGGLLADMEAFGQWQLAGPGMVVFAMVVPLSSGVGLQIEGAVGFTWEEGDRGTKLETLLGRGFLWDGTVAISIHFHGGRGGLCRLCKEGCVLTIFVRRGNCLVSLQLQW
ncbi:unnamed protein product [Ilex paraguariensis]|uniref:Uncharacterized protein n=1 Tax=Ilex paraguariensis TaxID=185542 RepID=A0ABC8UQZ0_9AQUA